MFIKIGPLEREFPNTPLQILPFRVTDWYDWVKGIEPHRETEEYLQRVEDLNNKVNQVALESSKQPRQNNSQTQEESIDEILKDLRDRSVEIIDTNPFLIANKTGILERIKNKMRDRVFGTENASAKQSFERCH